MTEPLLRSLQLPDALLQRARTLDHLGVGERAWPRDAAIAIIRHLRSQGVAVLGGDVLSDENGTLRHNYANWHSDPRPAEAYSEFALRSQEEALAYLEQYPSTGPTPWFVLVLTASFRETAT